MLRLEKILLRDILVKDCYSIGENEPFSNVWEMFRKHRIRHLPVVDDQKIVKGIITQRDLYKTMSPRKTLDGNFIYDKFMLDRYILKNIMNKEVITLSPQDTLGSAIEIMVSKKYGCIPIVSKEQKLVGVVTQIDVLRSVHKYVI